MEKFAVGIDLGTTYSVVAVYRNDNVEVVHNEMGNRITPSCVAFKSSQILVGEGAADQAPINPENTIYNIKRIMGRNMKDDEIQEDICTFAFQVVERNNELKIQVQGDDGEVKHYFPEELSAMILQKMKSIAEDYLAAEVKEAVITCPAYFNNAQRQATKDAAELAGLKVLRLINEPTAAALAYGLKFKNNNKKNVLVFDLGGGTFDVCIVTIQGKKYTVQAINGDTHLGGQDFDQRMVEYFVEKFKTKDNIDISDNKGLMICLKQHCEKAKRILSFGEKADFILEGIKIKGYIARPCFEDLNFDLFEKTISLVQETLNDAGMTKDQIDDVVLVGGSTRIPKIKEMLSEFFNGKKLSHGVHPDEAVASGAAIQAAMIQNELAEHLEGLTLNDVCPLSLGCEVKGGSFCKLISRNTLIPTTKSQIFQCGFDNQTAFTALVFEGERVMAKDNHYLGKIEISTPPLPRYTELCQLTFEVDENSILTVTCKVLPTGQIKTLIICNKSRLCDEEANRLAMEANKFHEEDAMHKTRLEAFHDLDNYIYDVKQKINKLNNSYATKKAEADLDWYFKWLIENIFASKEVFEAKKKEVEEYWNNLEKEFLSNSQFT